MEHPQRPLGGRDEREGRGSRNVNMASRIVRAVLVALSLAQAVGGAPVRVVTTIFPLTDWARAVGGDRVEVTQLLPPGVEAHAYAPRPRDILALQHADLFIYLGPDMEPWAERLATASDRPGRTVLEAARGIPRLAAEGEFHDQDPARAGDNDSLARGKSDPHVWLDPVLAQRIVTAIAAALAQADPAGAETYQRNAQQYNERLEALHRRIEDTLRRAKRREILYGGHFAFGYFARRYGLGHRSPYPGFSPNAAPTPRAVAELIRQLRDTGQKIIFHEELVDPKVASVIAEETGARLVLLHGAHNLSAEEARRGDVTYLSIMEDNLRKLAEALEAE